MDIQIKDIDAVISACEELQRDFNTCNDLPQYGISPDADRRHDASWGFAPLFEAWESNTADRQELEEKVHKLHENMSSLNRAMNELSKIILTYATSIKETSSKSGV